MDTVVYNPYKQRKGGRVLNKESFIREICLAIPIICPVCKTRIPDQRIDLKDMKEGVWYLRILCGECNKSYTFGIDTALSPVKTAIRQVCGDRGLSEEFRLRNSGQIPPFYEKQLPQVLGKWWNNGPKENPFPPRTAA